MKVNVHEIKFSRALFLCAVLCKGEYAVKAAHETRGEQRKDFPMLNCASLHLADCSQKVCGPGRERGKWDAS